MAIYDTGTASLAANGSVTGVGTQWTMPLTLIRVGATIIFKTNPLKIYTISEITSDTSLAVYNPKSETVPAGTGYAILAHDGISVQGLAQDVAETLRYYQSKETSIQGLLDFIGQDSFDWPRFEKLANQSVTGAADALASQIAAAESAATAVSARNTTTAARDQTIEAINKAGDASTMVALAGVGINTNNVPFITTGSEFDWQNHDFVAGENLYVNTSVMINSPPNLTFPPNVVRVWIICEGVRRNSSFLIRVISSVANNAYYREYEVHASGVAGSRSFAVRELLTVPSDGSSVGGASAERVRGLLDVYSKGEVSGSLVVSFNDGGTITSRNQSILLFSDKTVNSYHWNGPLPKTIPRNSTPYSTGGISPTAWMPAMNGYESSGISVKNFGAVGDGVTDDGSAIQAAMDYCQQNRVDLIFPSGKYMISYPLIYRNNGFYNYSIIGSGGSSEIVLTTRNKSGIIGNDAFGIDVNQNAAIVVVTDTNQSKYCRISGLRFSTTVNADYGVFLSVTENSLISDCFFEGFKFGIFDSGSWVQRISRCIARNVTDTGFYIADGTSTFITECYADYAERGYYLKAGYSSIQNSAADHCSRWSYVFGGGAGGNAETDAITVSMNNCGSENSGTGAAIYVDGRVSLGVSNYHAGNYEPYQTQKTPFLVDVSSRGRESNFTFNNVRCVNFEYLFNDSSSSGNLISLTNVTSRSELTGKYLLSSTSKLIENSVDGVVVFTGNNQSNRIGLSGGDVKDGNSNNSYSGLRNSQVIYRATIPVNRDSGASSGIGAVSLPFEISSYSVSVCYNGNYEGIDSLAMVFGVTQKTSSGFIVLGTSAKSSQAWNTIYVDVIVYGV